MTQQARKVRHNVVRTFALLLASSLVLAILSISIAKSNTAFADDRNWYVGEGVKQGMYVTYNIQFLDTNDGRPFEMTIYFKEQDSDGNWIAPTFVVDRGQVYNGTLKLSSLDLTALGGGSKVPPEMQTYVSAYTSTLKWLSAFTTKPGLSLDAASWGKIGSIGGAEVMPVGNEKVTVPAGTYDTKVIGWHKGVDNRIWILNEFPYPIKAQVYAEVTTGNPPTQYAFELLKTGNGEPPLPTATQVIPTPPLEKDTGRGTYHIKLEWEPASIEPGKDIAFAVAFSESSGFPVERVNYDFVIKDAAGNTIQDFKNQNTGEDGFGVHNVKFDKAGPIKIIVTINSVSGVTTGQFVENADFNIVVVPEFPISAALVMASIIGFAVVMTRFKGIPRLSNL